MDVVKQVIKSAQDHIENERALTKGKGSNFGALCIEVGLLSGSACVS